MDEQDCLGLGLGLGEWFDNLEATARSDVLRGGLWLDGSTLLLRDFMPIVFIANCWSRWFYEVL